MARFSERMGFRSAQQAIQLDSMDDALRNGLWNVLTELFLPDKADYLSDMPNLKLIVTSVWTEFYKQPRDTINNWWPNTRKVIRDNFFTCKWLDVFDLIEFCVETFSTRAPHAEAAFNRVLGRENSGYRIVGGVFAKITSEQELAAVDSAQRAGGKFSPAASHIQRALDLLTRRENPDFRNSIKESISAVEAACCIISNNDKITLGQALKQLESQGVTIHKAQQDAFSKLYGYTSNADGIRHALLDEEKLTYEDAQFMLVTCSAFVNYLIAIASAAKSA